MNFEEYQKAAQSTAIYPTQHKIVYPALGLGGESGECLEKVKKHIRDKTPLHEFKQQMLKELGDVLWYVAAIASDLDLSMNDIAEMNVAKLKSRQDRDVLHGSGDDR